MTSEGVTVITITRNRPELLARTIASVAGQRAPVPIRHLVLVDACAATRELLQGRRDLPPGLVFEWMARVPGEHSGPGRSARMLNAGVGMAETRFVAFLDDDNLWDPDHVERLADCARRTRARAVHSHRRLVRRDGTPYLEQRHPWCRDPERGRALYERLRARGIYVPGSNVMRDRADPRDHPDPVRTIDKSEWLIERDLLLEVRFTDEFSADDAAGVVGEDDKLLEDLVARGERICTSGRASLVYTLGGYSNDFDGVFDASFSWASAGRAAT